MKVSIPWHLSELYVSNAIAGELQMRFLGEPPAINQISSGQTSVAVTVSPRSVHFGRSGQYLLVSYLYHGVV